ncbi:hypothetical protein D9615_001432 [Tricholomella constricta]|uniref:RING-CH-type domain-containing protein n=1 Tax=Tricholomella constricta TaxID=117010 RepID=A0A8H5HKM1_9AGAR|nr:hypothetical protein D9615_001432 [Tricholomella constricta]
MADETPNDEKQCRICLDGVIAEPELGRLIRPCLCRGSISYVHIKCLHRWRNTSASKSAFFACPQCRYQYRFTRTKIAGIATNPIIVGGISGLVFTFIVMLSSFITTFFMSWFEEPSYVFSPSYFYVSPLGLVQDLITAALRILKDEDITGIFDDIPKRSRPPSGVVPPLVVPKPRGLLMSFVRRFVLGLPMVGAGSLVYMLLSVPFLGPLQWLARQRGGRRRRDQSRDIAAMVIVALVAVGAARALYQVFKLTEATTKRLLLRAEDAILEVN